MRKNPKQFTWSLLCLLIFLGSCNGKNSTENTDIITDSVKIETVIPLKNDTNSAACRVTLNFTYAEKTSNPALKDSINRNLLRDLLGYGYENMPVKQALDSFKTDYIKNYKDEMTQLLEGESEFSFDENSGIFNYSKDLKCRMIYNANDIITFRADVYEYTGGAHGLSNSFLFNFDVKNGQRIRLNDIFTKNYEEKLDEMLIQQLLKDNEVSDIKELEELGYFVTSPIFPTDNFYFDDKNIIFLYNPYEIAPYAMGSTEIKLPIKELTFLMKEKKPISKLLN